MSASLLSKDAVRVCVCVWKKGKDTGFEPKWDSCVCHTITVAGTVQKEEKNNPLDPLLQQLSDKGLSFLQRLWRNRRSKGLEKALEKQRGGGKTSPFRPPIYRTLVHWCARNEVIFCLLCLCSLVSCACSGPNAQPAWHSSSQLHGAAPLKTQQLRIQPTVSSLGCLACWMQRGASWCSMHPVTGWADLTAMKLSSHAFRRGDAPLSWNRVLAVVLCLL